MNPEPKKPQNCEDEDEVTVARSILDEIIEETESEDWDKEKPEGKTPPADNQHAQSHLN